MPRRFILASGVAQTNDKPVRSSNFSWHSFSKNQLSWNSKLLFFRAAFRFAFAAGFTAFDLGLSTLGNLRFELGFLDDGHRSDDRIRIFVDLDALGCLDVRNVQRLVQAKAADIHIDRCRSITGLAEHSDLANGLDKQTALFFDADRLADKVKRHGHFHFFTGYQTPKIGVDHSALHRVDLAVLKNYVCGPHTCDVQRENSILS